MENRTFDYEVMDEIQQHWSPRAFDSQRAVPEEELMAVLEAARYAPSCFNEQPWRFIVAKTPQQRDQLASILSPSNKLWAEKAPVLLLILSKQLFARNGKPNRWHQFDAGTSWGYLLLEAQRRGIITHAMAGFNPDLAREIYAIPEDLTIITVVALGYYGNITDLDPELQTREHPSPRLSTDEILFKY
jgi:nitroreductase